MGFARNSEIAFSRDLGMRRVGAARLEGSPVVNFRTPVGLIALVVGALLFLLIPATWAEPLRQELDVGEYGDVAEVKSMLEMLVPELKLEVEDDHLVLISGSKEMVEQCLELIRQLNQLLDRFTLRAQLVGLNPSEQDALGLNWRQAAIGNAAGITYMDHFQAQTDRPLTGFSPNHSLVEESVAESGSTTTFRWSESFRHHFLTPGGLAMETSPIGLDVEVTANAKSDGKIVCKFLYTVHLAGRTSKQYSDVLLDSGCSVAVRNLFPEDRPLG